MNINEINRLKLDLIHYITNITYTNVNSHAFKMKDINDKLLKELRE